MKARKQCPKCSSLRVGYLETRVSEDRGQGSTGPKPLPLGVTEHPGIFFTTQEAFGELEAYLCADCGFLETYVKNPAETNYDELVGFHWLNPDSVEEGPYR